MSLTPYADKLRAKALECYISSRLTSSWLERMRLSRKGNMLNRKARASESRIFTKHHGILSKYDR
jgi:hypothetical protein